MQREAKKHAKAAVSGSCHGGESVHTQVHACTCGQAQCPPAAGKQRHQFPFLPLPSHLTSLHPSPLPLSTGLGCCVSQRGRQYRRHLFALA